MKKRAISAVAAVVAVTSLAQDGRAYGFVPPGILYREAQMHGYRGSQEHLLTAADMMVQRGVFNGRPRGRSQCINYQFKKQKRVSQ